MRVQIAATLEVRATFDVDPGAWPQHWTPREVASAVEAMYQDDPAALLEAFDLDAVRVSALPA